MIQVAIDGPAGAGKSTVARAVALRLGLVYVDTGALYRAIALFIMRRGIFLKDEQLISTSLADAQIKIALVNGQQRVLLCGEDVCDKIRTPEVSMAASVVSAIPKVRDYLLELQRKQAEENDVIMDGRDIGTVVLPNAGLKIFLSASDVQRAHRRHAELLENDPSVSFEQVLKEIRKRDQQDTQRKTAPLKQAGDAVLVDTSHLTLEQSIEQVLNLIKDRFLL